MSANITPAAAKSIDPTEARRQRGLAIAEVTRIAKKDGHWMVPSQAPGGRTYRVILDPAPFVPMCTCKDYVKRQLPCKHVFAVRALVAQANAPVVEGMPIVSD
jgi:SWIM zinc finger